MDMDTRGNFKKPPQDLTHSEPYRHGRADPSEEYRTGRALAAAYSSYVRVDS